MEVTGKNRTAGTEMRHWNNRCLSTLTSTQLNAHNAAPWPEATLCTVLKLSIHCIFSAPPVSGAVNVCGKGGSFLRHHICSRGYLFCSRKLPSCLFCTVQDAACSSQFQQRGLCFYIIKTVQLVGTTDSTLLCTYSLSYKHLQISSPTPF